MTFLRRDRRWSFILLAVGIIVGTEGVAVAATTQASGYTYIGQQDCAWGQTWISSDRGQPFMQSVATMDWWDGANLCGNHAMVAQRFAIAVKQDLIYWNTNTNQWTLCNQGPWVQNQNPAHDVWTSFRWGSRPCFWGHWFYSSAHAMTWNGAWHGMAPNIDAQAVFLN